MYHPVKLLLMVGLTGLIFLPSPVLAQEDPGKADSAKICGELSNPEATLRSYRPLFFSEEEGFRQLRESMGLERLSPSASVAVVADPDLCGQLVPKSWKKVNELISGPRITPNELVWAVFRYGPYRAVVLVPKHDPSEDLMVMSHDLFLVFDGETLEFLDWAL